MNWVIEKLSRLVTYLVTTGRVSPENGPVLLHNLIALVILSAITLLVTAVSLWLMVKIFKWNFKIPFLLVAVVTWVINLWKHNYYLATGAKVAVLIWLGLYVVTRLNISRTHHEIPPKGSQIFRRKKLLEYKLGRILVASLLIVYVLPYLGGTFAFQTGIVTVRGEEKRWSKPPVIIDEPIRWTGEPFDELPEGVVIPNVWDGILTGVKLEGGTNQEAVWLYATQQTECTNPNGICVSSVGALGWFQFMPGTWAVYAEPEWDPYDLVQATRAAYRMFKQLQLFEQTTRIGFQNRFTGEDGGLAWNMQTANPDDYDGWGQAGIIWDSYQEIVKAAQEAVDEEPDFEGIARVEIEIATMAPEDQIGNILLWSERNRIEIPAGEKWDFCQETDRTGWDGYSTAGGFLAGGICANASLVYTWANQVDGLVVDLSYAHTPQGYPVFTIGIVCPDMSLTIRNTSGQEIIGEWRVENGKLILEER